jgi:hypothetical protein
VIEITVTLLIGFSIMALAILLAAYLGFFEGIQKTALGKAACTVLCAGLAALQLEHLHYVRAGADLLASWHYLALLFVVPPAFYLFSRDILLPGRAPAARDALHLAPVAGMAVLPPGWIAPLASRATRCGWRAWFTGCGGAWTGFALKCSSSGCSHWWPSRC